MSTTFYPPATVCRAVLACGIEPCAGSGGFLLLAILEALGHGGMILGNPPFTASGASL
jgi:hypothetical protein